MQSVNFTSDYFRNSWVFQPLRTSAVRQQSVIAGKHFFKQYVAFFCQRFALKISR